LSCYYILKPFNHDVFLNDVNTKQTFVIMFMPKYFVGSLSTLKIVYRKRTSHRKCHLNIPIVMTYNDVSEQPLHSSLPVFHNPQCQIILYFFFFFFNKRKIKKQKIIQIYILKHSNMYRCGVVSVYFQHVKICE